MREIDRPENQFPGHSVGDSGYYMQVRAAGNMIASLLIDAGDRIEDFWAGSKHGSLMTGPNFGRVTSDFQS